MAKEEKITVPVKPKPPKVVVSGDFKITVNPPFVVERRK